MIEGDGPMPLDRYMNLCLGHPEHGYYRKGEPVGARGAFTTAPEISQMFGEMIGAWCHALWTAMGSPKKFHWMELGPGRGTLFSDMLRVAKRDPAFLRSACGTLVESSPLLQQAQRTHLQDSEIPLSWVSTVDELASDAPVIVVANEFFDALPIRQAVKGAKAWHERKIGAQAGELVLGISPDLLGLALVPEPLRDAPPGSIVEFSPARDATLRMLAARIRAQGGAMLIVDYGYEGPALGDTFQAMRAHGFAGPLEAPGDADLTAHVDFTALKDAALGLPVFGPVSQGQFLERLGIVQRADRLKSMANPAQSLDVDAALRRLTHPKEMGALFKVMAICQENMGPPPGFSS